MLEGSARRLRLATCVRIISLRVYAHWLSDTATRKGVDRLDDAPPSATSAQPDALTVNERNQLSRVGENGEPDFRELEPGRRVVATD